MTESLRTIGLYIAGIMAVSLILGLLMLAWVMLAVRHIDVPADATYTETMQYTPFIVVVMIDLLDLGLDFLAAPVSWVILDRLGLKALRGVATVEALIPLTQAIPTLTLSWIAVRVFKMNLG